MNAQSIVDRIAQDAREAGAALLRDAQARAEALRAESERRVESARGDAEAQARRDAVELDDRMIRMARLDARKAMLAEKRAVLDTAFDTALARMRAMPAAQAREFGMRLLLEAAQGGETVVTDPASAWCDASFIKDASARLAATGKPALVLSDEKREMGGGFALLREGMEINCSFKAALEAQRVSLEAEIASMLFD